MLDIKLIRDQPELVRNNLEKRKKPEFLNMLDTLIDEHRYIGEVPWAETEAQALLAEISVT